MKKIFATFLILLLSIGLISCKKKNDSKQDEPEVHNHTYTEFISRVEPTCTKEGTVGHYECTTCHKYFDANLQELTNITIDKEEHELGEITIGYSSTCTSKGQHDYKQCTKCEQYFTKDGELLSSIVIDCVEHELSALHPEVAATCYGEGTIAYYSCSHCETRFDKNLNPVNSISIPAIGHHEYAQGADKCSVCNLAKSCISVAEAKSTITDTTKFTITAVVVGVTSTYDGGYTYLILKDILSDELIGVRKQVQKDGLDNADTNFLSGYSYAPKMPFSLGDIVELPVSILKGSTTTGGNNELQYLIYRGKDIESYANTDAFLEDYVVDNAEDYEANIDNYKTIIQSNEDLNNFVKNGNNQWQLVVFKGTKENPIHFVTNTAKTSDQFTREYIIPYYGKASKLGDLKRSGAYPVFSNFGNTFNLTNSLATLLFNQTEYKAPDYNDPYQYEGEIYALIVGGSTSYYHFIVLNQDSIKNDNAVASSEVGASVAKQAFFKAMEEKAKELGINIRRNITSAVGVSNVIGINDLVKIGIAMTKNEKAMEAWSDQEFIGTWKTSTGATETMSFPNAVAASELTQENIFDVLGEDSFVGAKGGSLKYTTSRGYQIQNLCIALKGPDNTIVVVAVAMNIEGDLHDDSNKYLQSRLVYQILVNKYNGLDTTSLESQLDCAACAGVVLPATNAPENGYDWFGDTSEVVNYSKNGETPITTASVWKMMTCITALDYVSADHYNDEILVETSELSSISNSAYPKYVGGEIVSFDVALHSMMRRSSNVSPSIIARYVGAKIVLGEFTKK